MVMGTIWTMFVAISILSACKNGCTAVLAPAALEGAKAALELCFSIGGAICLWCGVMELMRRCGLAASLGRLLFPVLKRIFPESAKHPDIMQPLAANVSANILGLGNAATPMGIKAAKGMARLSGKRAANELCRLVVLNTASIQLIPTTVAAIRASCSAAAPFDILPSVWISSALSVAVGLLAAKLFERLWE